MKYNQYPKDRVNLFFFLCFLIAFIYIVFFIGSGVDPLTPSSDEPILIATSNILREFI